MKRFIPLLIVLSIILLSFQNITVFFADSNAVREETDKRVLYSETKLTKPEFKKDKYYKIYNDAGQAVTLVEDTGNGNFVFEDPQEGNKRQEWQIFSDPKYASRFRIISKYSGDALAISNHSVELVMSPVDLNNEYQEWFFSYSKGMFNIKVNNIGKLTYSAQRIKATSSSNTAKQFAVYEINEAGWELDWSDDFDGELDETKWNRSDGHLQGEGTPVMNVADSDHIYTDNGDLVLVTDIGDYGGYEMHGGMVDTAGKYAFSYGKIEMRAKLPKGEGTFPALWLLGNENLWPGNGEIDVMEIDNDGAPNMDSHLYGTLHWADSRSEHVSDGRHFFNKDFKALGDDYHTYALEWEYDQIRLFFDDMLYMSLNLDNTATKYSFGDEPHFIILDNWIYCADTGRLLKDLNYEQEYVYRIDYIKTYKRAGTANYDIEDQITPDTTVTSTASDVIARLHDWDEEIPLAVSPDGKEIAVAQGQYFLYVIDAETMLQKHMMTLNPMFCMAAISYSPDGSKLAVSDYFGTVYVFDTSDYSADPLVICDGTVAIEQVVFTPDSESLIISGLAGRSTHIGSKNMIDGSSVARNTVRMYSVLTGELLLDKQLNDEARGTALSNDGRLVAFALFNGQCAVLNTSDYSLVSYLNTGDTVQLRGVSFSPDDSQIAVSGESGEICLFDVATGELVRKMNTVTKTSITKLEYSKDGTKLLANSSDNCARIYNVSDGMLYAVLGGFNEKVTDVSYSPDGLLIAVGSFDGRIKLFTSSGEYLYTLVTSLAEENGYVYDLVFSPDSMYVYATTYTVPKAVHRWRTDGVSEGVSAEYDDDFLYRVEDGNAVITGYRGNTRDIVIPAEIDGYTVTEIDDNAFNYFGIYWRNITVTLPDTLKVIGDSAFKNCWSIKSIVLPEGLERIGSYAFHGCKMLTEFTIPDSVTYLGTGVFEYCHGLKTVTIGGGVKTLQSGLFGRSRGIKKVILKDGIECLEDEVFANTLIDKVYFPDSVVSVSDKAFEGEGIVYGSEGSYAQTFCAGDRRYTFCVTPSRTGDANADYEVTVADVLLALRISLGITKSNEETVKYADINKDGIITVYDAMMILRITVGMEIY